MVPRLCRPRLSPLLALCALVALTLPARGAESPARKKVAILLFDGVQIIDFTAPYEVLAGPFEVFTVGSAKTPIATAQGMRVVPDYTIAEAPAAEILLVPGGGRAHPEAKSTLDKMKPMWGEPGLVAWLKERARGAEMVVSVCNGAFTLVEAGLLDGLEATTTASLLHGLAEVAPTTRVRHDARYVDNGRIVTAGGLSAGIDVALHIVERYFGRGVAQQRALGLEYPWDPEGGWARPALADRYMRFLFNGIPDTAGWKPLAKEGGRDRWTNRWQVAFGESPGELRRILEEAITGNVTWGGPAPARWERDGAAPKPEDGESRWKFVDEQGKPWNGRLAVTRAAGEAKAFEASLSIERSAPRP